MGGRPPLLNFCYTCEVCKAFGKISFPGVLYLRFYVNLSCVSKFLVTPLNLTDVFQFSHIFSNINHEPLGELNKEPYIYKVHKGGEWGVLKLVMCLRILLSLSNRSIVRFCRWRGFLKLAIFADVMCVCVCVFSSNVKATLD